MKRLLTLFFLLFAALAQGQRLANTEWVRIAATRKDGSRIVERNNKSSLPQKYLFSPDSLFASVGNQYNRPEGYSVRNGQVFIYGKPRYSIDSLSEMLLVLTDLGDSTFPDELRNTYVLLNTDYQFDYAKQEGDLKLQGDTLIRCTNRFTPIYRGDISWTLLEWLKNNEGTRSLDGAIILTPAGRVQDIRFSPDAKFKKKQLDEIRSILLSTDGNWMVPPMPHPYLLEVPFMFQFTSEENSSLFSMVLTEKNPASVAALSKKEIEASDKHFRQAVLAFEQNELEKASAEFERCLAIDELNLTARYNLAVVCHKLGRLEEACAIWGKLRDLGQKKADAYLAEYCRK